MARGVEVAGAVRVQHIHESICAVSGRHHCNCIHFFQIRVTNKKDPFHTIIDILGVIPVQQARR